MRTQIPTVLLNCSFGFEQITPKLHASKSSNYLSIFCCFTADHASLWSEHFLPMLKSKLSPHASLGTKSLHPIAKMAISSSANLYDSYALWVRKSDTFRMLNLPLRYINLWAPYNLD